MTKAAQLEREIQTTRQLAQELQRQLNDRPVLHELSTFEPIMGEIVHSDKIDLDHTTKQAVLAVAIRLEERADKRTLPNGAALSIVESLYERAAALREHVGEITEHDEEEAQELLQELIGTR